MIDNDIILMMFTFLLLIIIITPAGAGALLEGPLARLRAGLQLRGPGAHAARKCEHADEQRGRSIVLYDTV